jgi:hypothetical protein
MITKKYPQTHIGICHIKVDQSFCFFVEAFVGHEKHTKMLKAFLYIVIIAYAVLFLFAGKHKSVFTALLLFYIYVCNKQLWMVGHHLLLLRDFEPYGIIFMNVYVVITVSMVML